MLRRGRDGATEGGNTRQGHEMAVSPRKSTNPFVMEVIEAESAVANASDGVAGRYCCGGGCSNPFVEGMGLMTLNERSIFSSTPARQADGIWPLTPPPSTHTNPFLTPVKQHQLVDSECMALPQLNCHCHKRPCTTKVPGGETDNEAQFYSVKSLPNEPVSQIDRRHGAIKSTTALYHQQPAPVSAPGAPQPIGLCEHSGILACSRAGSTITVNPSFPPCHKYCEDYATNSDEERIPILRPGQFDGSKSFVSV